MDKKVGIIVPYRHRLLHLTKFKTYMPQYLRTKNIPFEIIIVNQDDAKLFNRGMLLNIGFKYAQNLGCDYVIFHDVDLLPVGADYSYDDKPIHLAKKIQFHDDERKLIDKTTFDKYFGGVTLFPIIDFIKVNGYSNKYWGWGYEDDDLLLRCIKKNIDVDEHKLKNMGRPKKSLYFNGLNSYVKIKNKFTINKDITIFASFYPDDITCDHTKENDTFTVFSIPGYDTSISFNSFSRYNFCTFTNENEVRYINTNIKTNYKTNVAITIDVYNKKIRMYQDGVFVDELTFPQKLKNYSKEEYIYLGAANPNREESPNYFKGYIDSFAIYDTALNDDEILEISSSINLIKNKTSKDLKLYYNSQIIKDYKLIDLTVGNNDGEIVNCDIQDVNFPEYKNFVIPHRRDCTFFSLPHEENGFENNKWKTQFTRWNQLRFINEVSKNDELLENDGLSNLEFVEHGIVKDNNITHINVGI